MKDGLAVPNPNPAAIHVKMLGACDTIRITFYTRAMTEALTVEGQGGSGPGWVAVPLGAEVGLLANGAYFYMIQGIKGGSKSKPFKGKLAFIR